jgi:FKBP-type peptidyl-prolyl isomerase-like protein
VDVREFLRRGDEVSLSPMFGPRMVIDLGRRECIVGLRYGIPGMRVGGVREIIISPHLAYGEAGIPGRIPANALLRCKVELIELRDHSALLPKDWLPGKLLLVSRGPGATDLQPGWQFNLHENGNSLLSFGQAASDTQPKQVRWCQVPIQLEPEISAELIRDAIELPKQIPGDCVDWNSGFIDAQRDGTVINDRRSGERCMVVQIIESGKTTLIIGVHENSPTFRNSAFYGSIDQLTRLHLQLP